MIFVLIEKELREFVRRPLPVAALFLVSLLTFLLSDRFYAAPAPLHTAVVDRNCQTADFLRALVAEQPELLLTKTGDDFQGSIWTRMDVERLHLVIVCQSDPSGERWQAFASLRDRDVARARQALDMLNRSLAVGCPWYLQRFGSRRADTGPPPEYPLRTDEGSQGGVDEGPSDGDDRNSNQKRNGVLECEQAETSEDRADIELRLRGGSARTGSTWLMPGMALMLSLLMAFYTAAAAQVRERALGAWAVFRLAPTTTLSGVLISKAALPFVLGLASLCIYLLLGEFFGLRVKANFLLLAPMFYVPAIAAAVLQGLILSMLAKSEYAAHVTSAGYLVAMIVFCGLLVPQAWSGEEMRVLGFLLPLSHALPAVEAGVLHGTDPLVFLPEAITLTAIFAASLSACAGLLASQLQRH